MNIASRRAQPGWDRCGLQPVAHNCEAFLPASRCGGRCTERRQGDRPYQPRLDAERQRPDLLFGYDRVSRLAASTSVSSVRTRSTNRRASTAYELGYKGEILDGTMQVNSAVYYYDYRTFIPLPRVRIAFGGYVSTSVFAVPGAEMIGSGHRYVVAGQPTDHVGCDRSASRTANTPKTSIWLTIDDAQSRRRCSRRLRRRSTSRAIRCCACRRRSSTHMRSMRWPVPRRSRHVDVPG